MDFNENNLKFLTGFWSLGCFLWSKHPLSLRLYSAFCAENRNIHLRQLIRLLLVAKMDLKQFVQRMFSVY